MTEGLATTAMVAGTTAAVVGCVEFGIWYFTRRTQERVDVLEREMQSLRDERVGELQTQIDQGKAARKELYVRLERDYVSRAECEKMHGHDAERDDRFIAAVTKLAVVEERITATAQNLQHIQEQQIALVRDVARLEGGGDKRR